MNNRILKIVNNSQAVIFYWQAKAGWPVEYVSENISMFGYRADEFLTGAVQYGDIIHPEDASRVGAEVGAFTAHKEDKFRQVYRILAKDGQVHWIDDRTVIERDENGQPCYYLGTIVDITQQKLIEQRNLVLSTLVDRSTDEVYMFDCLTLKFSYVNQVALSNLGYTLEEVLCLTPYDLKEVDRDLLERFLKPLHVHESPQKNVVFETVSFRRDGSAYPVEARVQLLEIDGRMDYVAVVHDISERKAIRQQREDKFHFVQEVIDGIGESVMVIEQDYTVTLMNNATRSMIKPECIADENSPKCYEVSHYRKTPCDGKEHPCPLQSVLARQTEVRVIHNHGHDGHDHYVELTARPLKDDSGKVYAIVESAHNVTDLIAAQTALIEKTSNLNYLASHDGLTGLPNRRLFEDRLDQGIERARRLSSKLLVVFIDVDKFKEINDRLGHQAGDEVLIEVAKRLVSCIRASDTVARLGGDEFTLLLEAMQDKSQTNTIMQKIMKLFETPINTYAGEVVVSLSAGLSCYPIDGADRKALIRNADLALYNVKAEGRGDFKFYDELAGDL